MCSAVDPDSQSFPVGSIRSGPPPEIYYWAHEQHLAGVGIHTTARDLNRFCRMMISDGAFEGHHYFNREDRQLVWAQHTMRPSDGVKYGLLWWLFPEEAGYVMSGSGRSLSAVSLESGVVVSVLRAADRGSYPKSFKEDKINLVRFARRLGLEGDR